MFKCLQLVLNILAVLSGAALAVFRKLLLPVGMLQHCISAEHGAAGVLHELGVVVAALLAQVAVVPQPVQVLAQLLHLVADLVIVQRIGKIPEQAWAIFMWIRSCTLMLILI